MLATSSRAPLGMETNQSAARAARRFLDERVRNDWDYPNIPPPLNASDEEVRDVTEFRERYYGESESSSGNESEGADPYKFDNPDSIGDAVQTKKDSRKRRRRARLEEEMRGNEGLRIWVTQRDLWTGAASVKKYGTTMHTKSADATTAAVDSQDHAVEDAPPAFTPEHLPVPTSSDSEPPAPIDEDSAPETFDIIPVAPRLLATNSIRASITPKSYPDLYQKIVVSSRTPSVPINLADMTKALVQGWKDSGEWPPKAVPLDPLAGKKRALGNTVNGAGGHHHGSFMENHPHMKKGVDSFRKMLHLNGHHHHHEEHAKEEGGKHG